MVRNLPAVRHDGPVSFFTAVLASDGSGWRARDVDLEEISDLEDLGEQLRAVALRDRPVIALIEREDQWFALVRADAQDDVRAFVSDAAASLRGHYAELLGPVADQAPELPAGPDEAPVGPAVADVDLVAADQPPEEISEDVDLDRLAAEPDEPAAPPPPQLWAGDADLLADLGVDAETLVDLVVDNPDDPAAVLADVAEHTGFGELLEALR
jgi:putative tRNA adenosine deaminase-associated protein